MKQQKESLKPDANIIGLQPPVLFSIPRPYEDDDFKRNATWYVKMQDLKKKVEKLKKNFTDISARHELRQQITIDILDSSQEIINNFIKKQATKQN